jgi:regulator of sirC expression with transglutaminase-like and TPR domain
MGAPTKSVRQLFADAIRGPDADIDLARAALLLAKEEYPQLSIEQYLGRLDLLAEEVQDRLGDETMPLIVLEELIDVLYEKQGFRGNSDAYYDPRNSFLNDVLDRRLGIPLSLGVVLLEVGWRLGLPLRGVNFPHHFLVRYKGEALDLLIDPFEGRIRFVDEAQSFLDRAYGGRVRVRETYLREASRRDMLVRMLGNLRNLYMTAEDAPHAAWVTERLGMLKPEG